MRRVRVGVKGKDDDMIVKERIITSFFGGLYFQQHFFVFSSALPMPRDCLMYLFYFSLLFFFFKHGSEAKGNTRTKEQTTNETPFPRLCKTSKYNPFSFFFFAILFCLCILFFSSVASPLVCSLSLFFFFPVFYFPVFPLLSSPSLCMCYSTYAV